MVSGVIGVIDSGIGGLSVLKELYKTVKGETFVYLGDNENVPYGNKSLRELKTLANNLTLNLAEYSPKCIILACNTLSLTVREDVEKFAGVPVFGVFPPVETVKLKGENSVLIATERTCEKYKEDSVLKVIPCKTLARDIEENKFSLEKYKVNVNGEKTKADTVILGCTHYEFIKNKLIDHFNAKSCVSGSINTLKTVNKWLKTLKTTKKGRKNQIIFIGRAAEENKKFWDKVVLDGC